MNRLKVVKINSTVSDQIKMLLMGLALSLSYVINN